MARKPNPHTYNECWAAWRKNTALITSSMTAIEQGGTITDAEGNIYYLPNIDSKAQANVVAANEQWQALRAQNRNVS